MIMSQLPGVPQRSGPAYYANERRHPTEPETKADRLGVAPS